MAGSTATSSTKESDDKYRSDSDNNADGGLLSSSKSDKAEDESDDEDDDDDVVNLKGSTIAQQQNDYEWEKKLLETLARVSLASVGGGLVGLSLDHTRRQQQQQHSYPASSRHRPPVSAPVLAAASSSSLKRGASLAKTWSVSCFLFAAILETTRWISPTTVLYDFILQQRQEENYPGDNSKDDIPADRTTTTNTSGLTNVTDQHVQHYQQQHQAAAELQRVALTVTGDYTIGGSMASFMVASLAHQKHAIISRNMPRPVTLFGRAAGVGLGTALGLFAGVVQATLAVGEAYIQQQQEQQQQRQQEHDKEPAQQSR